MVPTSSITDWISALSAAVTTLIAAVTAYYAYRQYLQPLAQEAEPDVAIDKSASTLKSNLVVFETSKQRTELKIGPHGLECWLQDKSTKTPKHQWSLEKSKIQQIIAEKDFAVTPGYKAQTGLFRLGERRNWLYSKKLFPDPEYLRGELSDYLRAASKKLDGNSNP
jgi:hypothetical protein